MNFNSIPIINSSTKVTKIDDDRVLIETQVVKPTEIIQKLVHIDTLDMQINSLQDKIQSMQQQLDYFLSIKNQIKIANINDNLSDVITPIATEGDSL